MRVDAQVGAGGHETEVPGQTHGGCGRLPGPRGTDRVVQGVLRHGELERPVHVVRREDPVSRADTKEQETAGVHQVLAVVRQPGREQKVHHQRTSKAHRYVLMHHRKDSVRFRFLIEVQALKLEVSHKMRAQMFFFFSHGYTLFI